MPDARNVRLTLRVSPAKAERLEALCRATGRSLSWHLARALDGYLETLNQEIAHISKGLADAEAGNTVPHETVRDWLMGWRTGDTTEPPYPSR